MFGEEVVVLLKLMIPQWIAVYLTLGFGRMTLALVGHYDPVPAHIAGAALGSMYSNVTGVSIGIGGLLAVGTFCAQNAGRGASVENGVVLRHARKVQALAFAFALSAALVSKPLLGMLGQPEEVLTPCFRFAVVQALGLPPAWTSFCLMNALNSQGVLMPGLAVSAISSATNVALSWLLLSSGVGYIGVALAYTFSNYMGVSIFAMYIVASGRQDTVWRVAEGQKETITLRTFIVTSVPSALSMWVEWWAAEVLAIIAGLLPEGQYAVAANGILFNTLALVYFTSVATQVSTSVRVGNLVGARDSARLPTALLAAACISGVLSCAGAWILYHFGRTIISLYTSNERILALAVDGNLGIVLSVPPYGIMMCLLGAMRSAGLQQWAVWVLVAAFYAFGIPAGAVLALPAGLNVGLLGVWLGNAGALTVAAVAMSIKVCTVDWARAVCDAMAYEERASPGDADTVCGRTLSGSIAGTPGAVETRSPKRRQQAAALAEPLLNA